MSPAPLGCEVVVTRSGAPAMRDRATGELMHPVVGPLIEAERLYVAPARLAERLAERTAEPLVVFDVGLGAGSNAIAAWRVARAMPDAPRRLELVSFERDLSALSLALHPEHATAFGFDGQAGDAARTLLAVHRHDCARSSWRLIVGELPGAFTGLAPGSADVVFWDPFSPRANPELWTVAAFSALRPLCREGATLHTYSGATATRTALLLAGFWVGLGATTESGRQTTQAATGARALDRPLDRGFLDRLGRSSAPFPVDAPADALCRIRALPQFR